MESSTIYLVCFIRFMYKDCDTDPILSTCRLQSKVTGEFSLIRKNIDTGIILSRVDENDNLSPDFVS